jgi:hypothetical protein
MAVSNPWSQQDREGEWEPQIRISTNRGGNPRAIHQIHITLAAIVLLHQWVDVLLHGIWTPLALHGEHQLKLLTPALWDALQVTTTRVVEHQPGIRRARQTLTRTAARLRSGVRPRQRRIRTRQRMEVPRRSLLTTMVTSLGAARLGAVRHLVIHHGAIVAIHGYVL